MNPQLVPWRMPIPEDFIASMMKAIVGFSIQITRIEAKYKLGQGRSQEDQLGRFYALTNSAPRKVSRLRSSSGRRARLHPGRLQRPKGSPGVGGKCNPPSTVTRSEHPRIGI